VALADPPEAMSKVTPLLTTNQLSA
jgi:hypothetical protein